MIVGEVMGTATVAGIPALATVTGIATEIVIESGGTAAGVIGTGTATGRRTRQSRRPGRRNARSASSASVRRRSGRRGRSGSASDSVSWSGSGSERSSARSVSAPSATYSAVIETAAGTEARIETATVIVIAKGPQTVTGGTAETDGETQGIEDETIGTGTERGTNGMTGTAATTRTAIGTGIDAMTETERTTGTEGMTATVRTGMTVSRRRRQMQVSVISEIFQRRLSRHPRLLLILSLLELTLESLLVRFPRHLPQSGLPQLNQEDTKVTRLQRSLILPRRASPRRR